MLSSKQKRIIRISLWSLLSLFVLAVGGLWVAMALFLRSNNVTALTNDILKESLQTEVRIDSVEVSLFRSFPLLRVDVNGGTVPVKRDSTRNLVAFERIRIAVSPLELLFGNTLKINTLDLIRPSFDLLVDENGISDLAYLSQADTVITEEPAEENAFRPSVDLRKLEIVEGNVLLNDRTKNWHVHIAGLNMKLKGSLKRRRTACLLDLSVGELHVREGDTDLIKDHSIRLRTDVAYLNESATWKLADGTVELAGVTFASEGEIRRYKDPRRVAEEGETAAADSSYVDIAFRVDSPTLDKLIGLIPTDAIDADVRLESGGSMRIEGKLEGLYSPVSFPVLTAEVLLEGVHGKYEGKDWGIDDISADMSVRLDLANKQSSYVAVNRLDIDAGNRTILLNLRGQVDDPLADPEVSLRLENRIDFNSLVRIFPLKPGYSLSGSCRNDLSGSFKVKDLIDGNVNAMDIEGKNEFEDIEFIADGSKIPDAPDSTYLYFITRNGELNFFSKNTQNRIGIDGRFFGLGFKNEAGEEMRLQNIAFHAESDQMDTTHISTLKADVKLGVLDLLLPDTLEANVVRSEFQVSLQPRKKDQTRATLRVKLNADSITAAIPMTSSRLKLSSAAFNLSLTSPSKVDTLQRAKRWHVRGTSRFGSLLYYMENVTYPVEMEHSALSVSDSVITLNRAAVVMGSSDALLTGQVTHLIPWMFFGRKGISGSLTVNSEYVDFGELMASFSGQSIVSSFAAQQPAEAAGSGGAVADSSAVPETGAQISGSGSTSASVGTELVTESEPLIVAIPDSLNLSLDVHVRKLGYGAANIRNVEGNIRIERQQMILNQLKMNIFDGEVSLFAKYRALSSERAKVGLDLGISRIDVTQLPAIVPDLYAMFPVMKSMQGILNLNLAADGILDRDLMLDLDTVDCVAALTAKQLVLLDSENFAKIAKTLKFKNRERNIIDSLTLTAISRGKEAEILPFQLIMDRYRLVVGGTQRFDGSFNYNVSVIKSPIPFKMGIDLFGDMEDFDFKLTKAKLKKSDFEEQGARIGSEYRRILRKIGKPVAEPPALEIK